MENLDQNQQPCKPVSIGDWMITILLMVIPLVNIIMLFVWAFGSNAPASKANWAKATLIWIVIGIVLGLSMWSVIAALFIGMFH